jgi:hypothetical protein
MTVPLGQFGETDPPVMLSAAKHLVTYSNTQTFPNHPSNYFTTSVKVYPESVAPMLATRTSMPLARIRLA